MTTNLLTLLACISMIESNDDDSKIGDRGKSRGRYQIQQQTWAEYGGGFWQWSKLAHDKPCADKVAKWIIGSRVEMFELRHDREPTTREIYLLWNCPAKVMKPSPKALATAIRFENLVKSKEGK